MVRPIAPKDDAPAAAHKKHAEEVLAYPDYKVKPHDLPPNDEVADKHQGGPGTSLPEPTPV